MNSITLDVPNDQPHAHSCDASPSLSARELHELPGVVGAEYRQYRPCGQLPQIASAFEHAVDAGFAKSAR